MPDAELKIAAINAYVTQDRYYSYNIIPYNTYWAVDVVGAFSFNLSRPYPNGEDGGSVFDFKNIPPFDQAPINYQLVDDFKDLRDDIETALHDKFEWNDLPDPASYRLLFDYLDILLSIYDIETQNKLSTRLLEINKALDGVSSTVFGQSPSPMTGNGAEALRKVADRIDTHCRCVHDVIAILRLRLEDEQTLWASARKDYSNTLSNTIQALIDYRHAEVLTWAGVASFLKLINAFMSASDEPHLKMISVVFSLAILALDSVNIEPPDEKSKSVKNILLDLDDVLNSTKSESGSLAASIIACEKAIQAKLQSEATTANIGRTAGPGVSMNFNIEPPFFGRSELAVDSCKPNIDIEQFRRILDVTLDEIGEEMNGAAEMLQKIVDNFDECWYRPPGLSCFGGGDSYGAMSDWENIANAILSKIETASSTIDSTIVPEISDYIDAYEALEAQTAHDFDQICSTRYRR